MERSNAARPRAFPIPMFVAILGVGLVIYGAISPWARVPTYSNIYGRPGGETEIFWVTGTEAPGMIPLVGDGMISLILAAMAGVLILWRLLYPPRSSGFLLLAIFAMLAVSTFVGSVNLVNVGNIPRADSRLFFESSVEVSWGLIVFCIGSWMGLLASGYQLWQDELR